MQEVFNRKDLFIEKIREYNIVLFVGNGSKNQYKKDKLNELKEYIKNDIKYLNKKLNDKWIVIYGGDNYNEKKPDIGYIINILNKENVKISAIQSDIVLEWNSPVDEYIDFVYYIKTDYDNDKKVIWGGFNNGKAVGPTKIYLEEFIKLGILKSIYTIGGGPISKEEVKYALDNNINVIYRRFELENKIESINENVRKYGFIEELLENNEYRDKIEILS